MPEQSECKRCGGSAIDPEDTPTMRCDEDVFALQPCRGCVIRPGVLNQIRKRMKGPAGATLFDIETLLAMVDELQHELDAALDPFNWAAVFTGDEVTQDAETTALTHGNLLTLDGTGQALFHYTPAAKKEAPHA